MSMNDSISAPIKLILLVAAVIFFGISTFAWMPPVEPHRNKLISAGLFCWALSQLFGS